MLVSLCEFIRVSTDVAPVSLVDGEISKVRHVRDIEPDCFKWETAIAVISYHVVDLVFNLIGPGSLLEAKRPERW